ncbi:MAG: DUF285 domain-containing protein [Acetatifactor sp.]|nr:DUF285 domain-containing protein [Acetatifactor sp.]
MASKWEVLLKTRDCRKLLSLLLSIMLLLETSGIQVFAEELQSNESTPATAKVTVLTIDETDFTGKDIIDAVKYYPEARSTDGEDTDIASGKYYGMDWRIDKDGLLEVWGENQYRDYAYSDDCWTKYADEIVSARVTATQVKHMGEWFNDCTNLQSIDFTGFDTSQVTSMYSLFSGCSSLTDLDLSNFDTSNVTDMGWMFGDCSSLASLDLSNFDTGNVTDMYSMFNGCSSLTDLDLSNFDTGNVIDMGWMFSDCRSLTDLDLSDFNTSNTTNMCSMFDHCSSLTGLDLSNFNTGSVTSMNRMFYYCSSLASLDLSNFDTSSVTDMYSMFDGCRLMTSVDLSNFDTSSVTSMNSMFRDCSLLVSLDLSSFDTSKVKDLNRMFYHCNSLIWIKTPRKLRFIVALPSEMYDSHGESYTTFPTKQEESIQLWCSLDYIPFPAGTWYGIDWSIDNDGLLTVSGEYQEDGGCTGNWRNFTGKIKSVKVMATGVKSTQDWFSECVNLQSVDFTDFDASNVTNMDGMFYRCLSLTSLDLSNMNLARLETAEDMLNYCDSLEWINTPINLGIDIALPYIMIDAGGNTYSALPSGQAVSMKLTKPSEGDEPDNKDIVASGKYYGMNWQIDKNGLLIISGEYREDDYSDENWCNHADKFICAKVDATNVKNTRNWFSECVNLQSVDFTDFDASNVTDMDGMFYRCLSLTSLDLSNMNLARLETAEDMLNYCDNLECMNTPINLKISITLPFPMSDADGNAYFALPLNQATSQKLTFEDGIAISVIPAQTYIGKAIKPGITVNYGKRTLTPGVDYTVSYKNNTNAAAADAAKAPTVIVKGRGNYTASITGTFAILAKPLTEANTVVAPMVYTVDGKVKTPTPVVTVDGVKLKAGKDYIVEFPDTVSGAYLQPGQYNVVVKGTGNYSGTITAALVICAKDQIQASKLKIGKIPACYYTEGTPAVPVPAVTYAGKSLTENKDYAISYRNNDKVGKATLIITGLENTDPQGVYVHGTVEKTFTIKGIALSKAKVNYDNTASFTGSEICPPVTLTLNGITLRPNKDYTVSYRNNINAGKATITLTGCGGYTGTVKKNFTIRPAEELADKLEVNFVEGTAIASYSQSGAKPAVTVKINETILQSGSDYTVTYKNNKKLATADAAKAPTVVIKGKGNYRFSKSVPFSIVEKSLDEEDIMVSAPDAFLGAKRRLLTAPTVMDGNGKKLKAGRDYIIDGYYINEQQFDGRGEVSVNTFVTVKLRGTGCYIGESEATYRIAARDISKTKVAISSIEFSGGATTLTDKMIEGEQIKVTDKAIGQELIYGTDYTIIAYKNNTKKGKATLIIQGIGERYGGTKAVEFSIAAKKLKK